MADRLPIARVEIIVSAADEWGADPVTDARVYVNGVEVPVFSYQVSMQAGDIQRVTLEFPARVEMVEEVPE